MATLGRVFLQHRTIMEWDSLNLLTHQEQRPAYSKFKSKSRYVFPDYTWGIPSMELLCLLPAAIIPYDVVWWHLSLGAQRCDSSAEDAYEENSNLSFQREPPLQNPDLSGTASRVWNSNSKSPPKEYFTFHFEMI